MADYATYLIFLRTASDILFLQYSEMVVELMAAIISLFFSGNSNLIYVIIFKFLVITMRLIQRQCNTTHIKNYIIYILQKIVAYAGFC